MSFVFRRLDQDQSLSDDNIQRSNEYTLFCEGKLGNPYPLYHQLRSEDPVHWCEPLQSWMLTRYADVSRALRDPRLSVNRIPALMGRIPGTARKRVNRLEQHLSKWLVSTDPPDHTRLRARWSKVFTPNLVDGMRGHVQQIVDTLLDQVQGSGQMDIIRDFAYPLPAVVISDMLGLPVQDHERFKRWVEDIMAFTGGSSLGLADIAEQSQNSVLEMSDYFRGIINERRLQPREDLISALIEVEEPGDKFNEEELLVFCNTLLTAGHDTTRNLIGNGLLALLKNPDQLRKLKGDPSLLTSAVEELLRFDSPLHRQTRVAVEDFEINGKHIRKGQMVFNMLGAANRDPAQFSDPDRLDICRPDNRHVAFGSGIHFCLGAPLARLEGRIAINTIVHRMPLLRLTGDDLKWRQSISVRGLESLPVVFQV